MHPRRTAPRVRSTDAPTRSIDDGPNHWITWTSRGELMTLYAVVRATGLPIGCRAYASQMRYEVRGERRGIGGSQLWSGYEV